MSFDKKLKIALDDIQIPDELSPANIEAMLRAAGKQEHKEKSDVDRSKVITAKRTDRSVIMRTLAAAAACVALAAGFTAFRNESQKPVEIESEIEYEAVQAESYDDLYNIYTGIYLNNSNSNTGSAENGDGVEIITDETAITEITTETATETTPPITEAVQTGETDNMPADTLEAVRSDFSDADIVKSDETSIYYICGGTLYVVSKADMAVTAEITSENAPFEMYISGNSLVLVSAENASDPDAQDSAEHNVCVEIYDVSGESPVLIKTFKQNGVYTSARVNDAGVLYLITGYSDYRAAPLDETANLENYVPGYYIDGEKFYVAAEDITIPKGANNTDYTVISAVNCNDPANASVKAVLGSSANAYCSETTLYAASSGVKDGRYYTTVTAFSLTDSGLLFKAAGTVEGELISRYSMTEFDSGFRIACRDFDENGMVITNIYTLDNSLNVVSTAGRLLPGMIVGSVKFDGNYASIIEKGGSEPALVVDLTQSLPVASPEANGFAAAYVNKFNDSLMVGLSSEKGENGNMLTLELYSADSGEKISGISFAQLPEVNSPALTDKKAMLIDTVNNIIGIPVSSVNEFGVKNLYYVFSCSENGFVEKGVIEFNDIDDSYKFERAVINDDVLYIIGSGRVVAVTLSDMTVVDSFDFQ